MLLPIQDKVYYTQCYFPIRANTQCYFPIRTKCTTHSATSQSGQTHSASSQSGQSELYAVLFPNQDTSQSGQIHSSTFQSGQTILSTVLLPNQDKVFYTQCYFSIKTTKFTLRTWCSYLTCGWKVAVGQTHNVTIGLLPYTQATGSCWLNTQCNHCAVKCYLMHGQRVAEG